MSFNLGSLMMGQSLHIGLKFCSFTFGILSFSLMNMASSLTLHTEHIQSGHFLAYFSRTYLESSIPKLNYIAICLLLLPEESKVMKII